MASLSFATSTNPNFAIFKSTKSHQFQQSPSIKLQLDANKDHQTLYKSHLSQISYLCNESQLEQAINLLTQMELEDYQIGPEIYGELLQGCLYKRDLSLGQQIHARVVKKGDLFSGNEFIETKLVIFYAKCDISEIASTLFLRLKRQNVFSWASIIGLKCRMGLNEEALLGLCKMHENGFFLDNFVIPNALKACGALQWGGFGKGAHGYVMKMGLIGCVFVETSLVDMYGKCGMLEDAHKVFHKMPERNVVAWNSMIVGFAQNGLSEEAIEMFYNMRMEGFEPSHVTISSFLSASANSGAIEEGKQGHAILILSGMEMDNIVGSSLINFYSKVGLIDDAELVFSRILVKDVVTWNLLVSGYIQIGEVDKVINTCCRMRQEHLRFDSVTLSSLLSLSSNTRNEKLGKESHCFCLRNYLDSDVVISSTLIDMYAKCEKLDYARRVFDFTVKRDVVLWNTILAAYSHLGFSGETLKLFYQMQLEGVTPNVISWNSVISGFFNNGQVDEARELLLQMHALGIELNQITWTTLISGLAHYGFGHEAILTFQQMQEAGIKPNIVSIICLLNACKNMASFRYGKSIHGYITRHNLFHNVSIATNLVDMYAKCGSINYSKVVFDMILNKGVITYNAMISAFALNGNPVEALALYRTLIRKGVEPDNITFTNALTACTHAGLINEGLEIFMDMVSKHNVQPSMKHYGCLVTILSKCGNIDEALKLIVTMPCKPDALIYGSLLAACREHGKVEVEEYLFEHLLKLEPGNSGNYIAISNGYAGKGMWDEVLKVRDTMKKQGISKIPGCSWIQVGEEVDVFFAGDESHPSTLDIYQTLDLLKVEMCYDYSEYTVSKEGILCS